MAFCFMPNHIHLLAKQIKDDGISKFMQKVGGYAAYFNKKYHRMGHLFNRFKAIHIKTDDQLKNTFSYIHCNPISLIEPGWKENGAKDGRAVINFLEKEYRWSSFFDYIGKKNFPSVTDREFLFDIIGGIGGSRQAITDWINYKRVSNEFNDIILE
jgi:hypothetical protein